MTVKEQGIIFNAEMVNAILDGRKTQTRRHVKKSPVGEYIQYQGVQCSFGTVGDRLWVRENFKVIDAYAGYDNSGAHDDDFADGWAVIQYPANGETKNSDELVIRDDGVDEGKQAERFAAKKGINPSIHMPRWASRIDLEITDVQTDRLHNITESDALAEGFRANWRRSPDTPDSPSEMVGHSAREDFFATWIAIYGQEDFDSNPWVWVVKFKRVK